MDQIALDLSRPREHLRLGRIVRQADRRRVRRGGGGDVRYPDQAAHGRKLEAEIRQLSAAFAKRVPVLGVDPRLVLVLDFSSPPEEDKLAAAQLFVLDWFNDRVVVAAPTSNEIDSFTSRLAEYSTGPRVELDPEKAAARKSAPTAANQGLFDVINSVRPFGPDDVPTPELAAAIAAANPTDTLRVDLQLWCPEDEAEARSNQDAVATAIQRAGGVVLDQTLRPHPGLSLVRADMAVEAITALQQLWQLRRADLLPRASLGFSDVFRASLPDLPDIQPPSEDAPLLAVIDSGVQSGHPLLAKAFIESASVGSLDEDSDGAGHGTFVASLALYGSLEGRLNIQDPLTSAARLVSIKVLDDAGLFPESTLWEADLLEAMELAVQAGARIINLSVGDERAPYSGGRPTALAAAVDEFARDNGCVVVVSAGNTRLSTYDGFGGDYRHHLLDPERPDSGLLNPATSILSLTAGGTCLDDDQGYRDPSRGIEFQPVARSGAPSPFTRVGPGVNGMVKPEFAVPAGDALVNTTDGSLKNANPRGVVGASISADRLLETRYGTSYAAPLISNIAARVWASDPSLTANGVRALVLLSSQPLASVYEGKENARTKAIDRSVFGYGRPDATRAAMSSDHRVVLVGEYDVPADSVHLYSIPVPTSFFESGGWRRISTSLAYDPEVRSTRLVPFSGRMHVNAYFGATMQQVSDAYVALARVEAAEAGGGENAEPGTADTVEEFRAVDSAFDAADETGDTLGAADASDGGEALVEPVAVPDASPGDPATPEDAEVEDGEDESSGPAVIAKYLLKLEPSDTVRGKGVHHFGTLLRPTRFDATKGSEIIIAVKHVSQWRPEDITSQPYGLAVALERDPSRREIYTELRAFADSQVDVPVEVEVEASSVVVDVNLDV